MSNEDEAFKRVKIDGGNILNEWGDYDSLTLEEKNMIVTLTAGMSDELIDAAFSGKGSVMGDVLRKALTGAYLLGKNGIAKDSI